MRAILTYHSIDDSGSPISVARQDFRAQVRWLKAEGVAVVSLPVLVGLGDESDAVALTFDDGVASFMTEAVPILEVEGMTATVFVVSGQVGGSNTWTSPGRHSVPTLPLLDWDELGWLRASGFEIGSHTRHHRWLPRCDDGELVEEIERAGDEFASALGVRPRVFAYPYGAHTDRVASAVARSHDLACTTEFRALHPGERALLLPRIDAYYLRGRALRRGWGTPGFRQFLAVRRALRAVGNLRRW
jgi:peptidoglycan/xylan/chitin deacetylase (PgdA/CDA1 family)